MILKKVIFGIFCVFAYASNASENSWPSITPAAIKKVVSSDASRIELKVFSAEKADALLYTLVCDKNGSDRINGLTFYGMFQCMFLTNEKNSADLLEGEESWALRAGDTRGVFTFEQMIGPCKSDTKFGTQRFFAMRNMTLAIAVKNFKSPAMADMLSGKAKASFEFEFDANISLNPKATSSYTSPKAEEYCNGYYEINPTTGVAEYQKSGLKN